MSIFLDFYSIRLANSRSHRLAFADRLSLKPPVMAAICPGDAFMGETLQINLTSGLHARNKKYMDHGAKSSDFLLVSQ